MAQTGIPNEKPNPDSWRLDFMSSKVGNIASTSIFSWPAHSVLLRSQGFVAFTGTCYARMTRQAYHNFWKAEPPPLDPQGLRPRTCLLLSETSTAGASPDSHPINRTTSFGFALQFPLQLKLNPPRVVSRCCSPHCKTRTDNGSDQRRLLFKSSLFLCSTSEIARSASSLTTPCAKRWPRHGIQTCSNHTFIRNTLN